MGSQIGSILAGLLFFSVFGVLLINIAVKENLEWGVNMTDPSYSSIVDENTITEQQKFMTELSDTSPGGSDSSTTDISGAVDTQGSTLKTLSVMFRIPQFIKSTINGVSGEQGLGAKVGINSMLIGVFITVFIVTVALILISAFLRNRV